MRGIALTTSAVAAVIFFRNSFDRTFKISQNPFNLNPKGRGTMRGILLTTAAVAAAIGLVGCGSGTFTDKRDGQKYRTVLIGGDRWMAQNLNYQTDSSWCYNDSLSYCKKYGRLYDWSTARTVCPFGYHLPSRGEWHALENYAGGWETAGRKLRAKRGWNCYNYGILNDDGTNEYGFSALPSGQRYHRSDDDVGIYDGVGKNGYWWTDTRAIVCVRVYYGMFYDPDGRYVALAVRCVADTP